MIKIFTTCLVTDFFFGQAIADHEREEEREREREWPSIANVSQGDSTGAVWAVLDNYPDIFTEELGIMYSFKATLLFVKDAKLRFHWARPVSFALKSRIEEVYT